MKILIKSNLIAVSVFTAMIITGSACKNNAEKEELKTNIPKAQVTTLKISTDTNQTYVAYIPEMLNEDWIPVLLCFDSQGRGHLAVERFRKAAEEHGFILVASNTLRNGLDGNAAGRFLNAFITDVKARFPIDGQHMFAAGFSGGGRIAIELARQRPDVVGAISIAAAPAGYRAQDAYFFAGIAGRRDFNYMEMMSFESHLQDKILPIAIFTHPGGHEWPKAELLKSTLLAAKLYAAGQDWGQMASIDREAIINTMFKKALGQARDGQAIEAGRGMQNIYRLSKGQVHLHVQKDYQSLISSETYISQQLQRNDYFQAENAFRQLINKNFSIIATRSAPQRMAQMDTVVKEYRRNLQVMGQDSGRKAELAARLNAFIGIMSYTVYNRGDKSVLAQDEAFLKFWELVDPLQPEPSWLLAEYFAGKAQAQTSYKHLVVAVDRGFADMDRLGNSPVYELLKNEPGFQGLIPKIEKNSQKTD